MRVWIDLANSPHVPLLTPVVTALAEAGHEVVLTVRDHAQTLALAEAHWPGRGAVVGGESPGGRLRKGTAVASRALALYALARRRRPDVAFSHGSYAQLLAARAARVPALTMMDFEYQPANHLSFRLAQRVLVPEAFPESSLRRCGAALRKVRRYAGLKEEIYLTGFEPDRGVLEELGIDPAKVLAVVRPPPDGALYHRMTNDRFEEILRMIDSEPGVEAVLLPRSAAQRERFGAEFGLRIPAGAIDGPSLVALADLVVGAGGTMNREAAVLGTPAYSLFAGEMGAVDRDLIGRGTLTDLRAPGSLPVFRKKPMSEADDPRIAQGERALQAIIEEIEKLGGASLG
ncbi:MAG: DUF354 domain-containing protein [Thermoleophilaceae bacterium]|nr:DUF354 domain-containing protein [Thermoleophilaceae bacterium]